MGQHSKWLCWMLTNLPMPELSPPLPILSIPTKMTQISVSELLGPTVPHNQDTLYLDLVRPWQSSHLDGATLKVALLDADKPAHARAFTTTSHPQYTHKDDSDKCLRAPWAHSASQSRYTLFRFSQALAELTPRWGNTQSGSVGC